MRFITPRRLVERYFKAPHFTSAELAIFNVFPGTLMRTAIFMNLCIIPHKGKNRKMSDIREYAPQWYVIASKIFVPYVLIHGFLAISLLIGIKIYEKIYL